MTMRRILALSLVAVSFTTVGCKARSTARVSRVEYRPAGGAVSEWTFRYDDDGYLIKMEKEVDNAAAFEKILSYREGRLDKVETEVDGNEVFQINYEYEDGRLAQTSSSANEHAVEDGLITITYDYAFDSDATFNWDDSGRLGSVDTNTETVSTTLTDLGILGTSTTVSTSDTETSVDYDYDDRGRLEQADTDTSQTRVTTTDGEETDRATDTSSDRLELAYADDGRLDSYTQTEGDSERKVRFRFDEDGKLIQSESELGGVQVEYDVEYDSKGRVERITDDADNKVVFDYDDGAITGATFGLSGAIAGGEFFDVKGTDFGEPALPNVFSPVP